MQSHSLVLPSNHELSATRDARLLTANIVFVVLVALYLLITKVGSENIQPLVQSDSQTAQRIQTLERTLQHDRRAVGSAIELAQIYREAGEFPFSYDALREAERTGTQEPSWRLKLGMAYLQLGKSDDALRVLQAAAAHCRSHQCQANVQVKLELFGRVAQLFKDRHIQPHKQRIAADNALLEVLKPVEVDPAKMRPKSPATTEGSGSAK